MSIFMHSSIPGSLGRGFYLQNNEWLAVISMIYSHIVIPNDQFIFIKGLGSAIIISFPSNNWPIASAPWRPTYPAASFTFPKYRFAEVFIRSVTYLQPSLSICSYYGANVHCILGFAWHKLCSNSGIQSIISLSILILAFNLKFRGFGVLGFWGF